MSFFNEQIFFFEKLIPFPATKHRSFSHKFCDRCQNCFIRVQMIVLKRKKIFSKSFFASYYRTSTENSSVYRTKLENGFLETGFQFFWKKTSVVVLTFINFGYNLCFCKSLIHVRKKHFTGLITIQTCYLYWFQKNWIFDCVGLFEISLHLF